MTKRIQKEFLISHLFDTQRLRDLGQGHPIMSAAFAERERELKKQIESIPDEPINSPTSNLSLDHKIDNA